MKLVVLTGIPGSGSTTLLNKALEEVDYVHLNYGDIMTEIAIKENIVEDRDSLRKLPAETQKEIQAEWHCYKGLQMEQSVLSLAEPIDSHRMTPTLSCRPPGIRVFAGRLLMCW